jgi:glycosyltransferase involved in cell wall biosynthesis
MGKIICIDARFYGVGDTGIGRYVQNLVAHLPVVPNVEFVLITNTKFHPYSLWAQLEMPWRLWQIKPDLVHIPHDAPPLLWFGKTILTIHDLTKLHSTGLATTTLPSWLYHFKHLGYTILLRLSLLKASHIITPSHYVKVDLITTFGINPAKISVIYEGVDHE